MVHTLLRLPMPGPLQLARLRLLPLTLSALTLVACEPPTMEGAAGPPSLRGGSAASTHTVSITGVTYEFATRRLIGGVEVSLDEHPEVSTRSGPDGVYTLDGVPAWSRVTPRVRARNYRPMWQRTLDVGDQDIDLFYFQMVPDVVYHAFAGILGVRPQRRNCQIVTTVTDPAMAEISSWEAFDAFIPHGQPGVEVVMSPPPPEESGPVYFTDEVIPSWELGETSTDGGVLWVNVPPPPGGVVTLNAHSDDPDLTFEPLRLTCLPGRLINASPPWGINTWRVDG